MARRPCTPQPTGGFADLLSQGLRSGGVLRVLKTVRKYLGMDVAFITHFRDGDRVFDYVDAEGTSAIYPGLSIPLKQGYCEKVALGQLPELIPDTSQVPAAMAIPETSAIPIGSHLSVPIQLHGGQVYGTLCCFSHLPDPTLGERDLKMMRAFAEVLSTQLDEASVTTQARVAKLNAVREAMADSSAHIVYQPIYGLKSGVLTGVECLSRFGREELRSPSEWFDLAEEVGLRQELEVASIQRALPTLGCFPGWVYFGLNCSPSTILSGALAGAIQEVDFSRLVIEVTEHAIVSEYASLRRALQPLRTKGVRLAIDDAGAGYASMRHILNLSPDFIKLDMSLTSSIDKDPSRRALARALASFSHEVGSHIIAEGIETEAELELLRALGVETGQGFLLGRPVPLDLACRPTAFQRPLRADQFSLDLA